MFFESWVLDWFAILNIATLAMTAVVYIAKEASKAK